MQGFTESQVWLGNWGKVWVDGELLAEATAFRAEVTINYEDITMLRSLMNGKKVTGIAGTGELKLHKVSDFVTNKIAADVKKGMIPDITIESSVLDPNGIGEQRIAVKHVKFEKISLADWEHGSIGEETYSFSFSDWELKNVAV